MLERLVWLADNIEQRRDDNARLSSAHDPAASRRDICGHSRPRRIHFLHHHERFFIREKFRVQEFLGCMRKTSSATGPAICECDRMVATRAFHFVVNSLNFRSDIQTILSRLTPLSSRPVDQLLAFSMSVMDPAAVTSRRSRVGTLPTNRLHSVCRPLKSESNSNTLHRIRASVTHVESCLPPTNTLQRSVGDVEISIASDRTSPRLILPPLIFRRR